MPVPQIATRTRLALHLLLMGAALTLITVVTSATTAATAKGTKSRSKIIVVKAKKYLLTVDGRFSLTSGDIDGPPRARSLTPVARSKTEMPFSVMRASRQKTFD